MLHPDGQYEPHLIPDLIAPIIEGEADLVLGTRMLEPGRARQAGMPLYKIAANRFLTTIENRIMGTHLTDLHSGYRAYSKELLLGIPFLRNSIDFSFDSEVLYADVRLRVPDRRGPGPDPLRRRGLLDRAQALDRLRPEDAVDGAAAAPAPDPAAALAEVHPLSPAGAITGERVSSPEGGFNPTWQRHVAAYALAARHLPRGTVLDLGCGVGHSYELLAPRETVGLDISAEAVAGQARETHVADMRATPFADDRFDALLSVHSLEHVPDPERVLAEARRVVALGGVAIFVTPNRLTFAKPDEIIDPYHYVELDPAQLAELCEPFFESVRILGIAGSDRYRSLVAAESPARPAAAARSSAPAPPGAPSRPPAPLRPDAQSRAAGARPGRRGDRGRRLRADGPRPR